MFYIFLLLLLVAVLTVGWIYVWLRWRRLRTSAVTNALRLIVGQNLPLVDGLGAMAAGERGATKRILKEIAARLAAGESVSAAVREAHPAVAGDVLGAIQAGEEAGTLPTVLRNIDRRECDLAVRNVGVTTTTAYVSLLSILVLAELILIVVFLVPKFRDIFADFGVRDLPWQTEALGSFVDAITVRYAPLGWLVWLVPILLLAQIAIGRHFLIRVPDRFQPLFRFVDACGWYCPGLRRLLQTRALARQLPLLVTSVRAGHGLAAAALHASRTDANWFARRRMAQWSERMTAGATPGDAARKAGLTAPLCRVVSLSRSQDELIAELGYLAAYYERLTHHWERIVAGIVAPLLVLLLSLVVGFVVVALYQPMRALIESLESEIW